ncbi:MAG: hypothetical protein GX312_02425, partial [Candidatus Phytoplasma sp.]|nr:hypothetical protein [Phytoplasma sp.]
MLSNSNLNSFLKLGYFLDYKNPKYKFDFSRIDKSKYATCTEKELINIGSKLLTEAITSKFECGKRHVVPISGGLDSRAILAGLLECTEAKNIETYTFGTPGTLDLEIGREVGLGLGTKHVSFALTEHRYDIEELLDISNRINHQTVLFHHPPVKRLSSIYGDSIFWMGSFAGPITGGSTEKERVENTLNAKKIFTHKNRYSRSVELSCLKDEDLFDLIEIKNNDMDLSEMADFYNRQVKFIAPHVLLEGFNYKIPFYDIELMSFFLSLD